jgi:4-hydroxy-tetrahydrodipicolinate reductase
MRVAVVGANGRMGRAVVRLAVTAGDEVTCAVGAGDVGRDAGELAGVTPIGTAVVDGLAALEHAKADVVIDFSAASVTQALLPIAAKAGFAIVSGTTGLSDAGRHALAEAAARVPVLWEPNMSMGIFLLSKLVAQAVTALGDWEIEIVETHHHDKIDAPSGTALRLAEVAARARTGTRLLHGRQGTPGARTKEEIGMHALRGGDVLGDHTVHLLGGGERIELTHRATSRDVFAHGALHAARWLVGKQPARYGLGDVLG